MAKSNNPPFHEVLMEILNALVRRSREGADFRQLVLTAGLDPASSFIGLNFTPKIGQPGLNLSGEDLNGFNFSRAKLIKGQFAGAKTETTIFDDADLTDAEGLPESAYAAGFRTKHSMEYEPAVARQLLHRMNYGATIDGLTVSQVRPFIDDYWGFLEQNLEPGANYFARFDDLDVYVFRESTETYLPGMKECFVLQSHRSHAVIKGETHFMTAGVFSYALDDIVCFRTPDRDPVEEMKTLVELWEQSPLKIKYGNDPTDSEAMKEEVEKTFVRIPLNKFNSFTHPVGPPTRPGDDIVEIINTTRQMHLGQG